MPEITAEETERFLDYVSVWLGGLPALKWAEVEREAGGPDNIAVLAVDVTNGFCKHGNLASKRVGAIVEPIVRLFRAAHERGVRTFILPQDCHPPDSPEFDAYGPHAVCGTDEAETVRELRDLPFSNIFRIMPKRAINVAIDTDLEPWLEKAGTPEAAIVTGDCTDLCVYQLATYLKFRSDARGERALVVVPQDCVDTYDVTVEAAEAAGIIPHPGELMHRLFLYHMMLNGIRVVQRIE
ncbi:MAG: cysteine hydrolase [Armatimonadota bacterium]|nr:MAG: cysteine hydrolase [Armatimonadota bacterium]